MRMRMKVLSEATGEANRARGLRTDINICVYVYMCMVYEYMYVNVKAAFMINPPFDLARVLALLSAHSFLSCIKHTFASLVATVCCLTYVVVVSFNNTLAFSVDLMSNAIPLVLNHI